MNKIAIAAELLAERAKNATDATAFLVKTGTVRITLVPDMERRSDMDTNTFYHMETVVDICRALHLSSYITCGTTETRFGIRAVFEVNIYGFER